MEMRRRTTRATTRRAEEDAAAARMKVASTRVSPSSIYDLDSTVSSEATPPTARKKTFFVQDDVDAMAERATRAISTAAATRAKAEAKDVFMFGYTHVNVLNFIRVTLFLQLIFVYLPVIFFAATGGFAHDTAAMDEAASFDALTSAFWGYDEDASSCVAPEQDHSNAYVNLEIVVDGSGCAFEESGLTWEHLSEAHPTVDLLKTHHTDGYMSFSNDVAAVRKASIAPASLRGLPDSMTARDFLTVLQTFYPTQSSHVVFLRASNQFGTTAKTPGMFSHRGAGNSGYSWMRVSCEDVNSAHFDGPGGVVEKYFLGTVATDLSRTTSS